MSSVKSNRSLRIFAAVVLLAAATLYTHAQTPTTDDTPDPALANLAPIDDAQQPSLPPAQLVPGDYPQQDPAPIVRSLPATGSDLTLAQPNTASPNELAGEEALLAADDTATTQAAEPPPPLPLYDQPADPEPNDLWTPGYWGYAPAGYYWVPGAWVAPPYYGALWTPPYWAFYGSTYRLHPGYWGLHVGYYGGIDYGFGYIGIGYFGGYWRGRDFYYNRNVTNVNVTLVHTTYTHDVVYNNVRYGAQSAVRISYNGGRGGIAVQPRPRELAAVHDNHAPALQEQVQIRQQAAASHAQFYNANHGAPPQQSTFVAAPANRSIAPRPEPAPRSEPAPQRQPAQPRQHQSYRPTPAPRVQPAPHNDSREKK